MSTRVEEERERERERVERIAIMYKCQSGVKCLSYPSPFVGYYCDCDSGGQRAREAGLSEGDLVTVPCLVSEGKTCDTCGCKLAVTSDLYKKRLKGW